MSFWLYQDDRARIEMLRATGFVPNITEWLRAKILEEFAAHFPAGRRTIVQQLEEELSIVKAASGELDTIEDEREDILKAVIAKFIRHKKGMAKRHDIINERFALRNWVEGQRELRALFPEKTSEELLDVVEELAKNFQR